MNTFSNTRLDAPDNRNRTGKNRSLVFVLKLVDLLAIVASAVAISVQSYKARIGNLEYVRSDSSPGNSRCRLKLRELVRSGNGATIVVGGCAVARQLAIAVG